MAHTDVRRAGGMILKAIIVKGFLLFLIIALAICALPGDSKAGAGGPTRTHWGTLRLQGVFITPLGKDHVEAWNECDDGWFDLLNFTSTIGVNTTGGFLASFEYVLKSRYGIEAGLVYWYEYVNLKFETEDLLVEGSPNFIMPTIGANYHVYIDETKDIYAGGLCCLGVIATGFGTDIEVSKDFALGLNLGMDYYVEESWSVGGSLKYIDFGEIDFSLLPAGMEGIICNNGLFGLGHLNNISMTVGIGYTF